MTAAPGINPQPLRGLKSHQLIVQRHKTPFLQKSPHPSLSLLPSFLKKAFSWPLPPFILISFKGLMR